MTDTMPAERPFWKIHLSTVVVIGAIVLACIGLNVIPRHFEWTPDMPLGDSPFDELWFRASRTMYGWPFPVLWIFDHPQPQVGSFFFDAFALAVNGALWGGTLCVPLYMEYLIRRRSKP
jgi:hypothetical protein